jgi:FPG/IleRS zinc finger protein
MGLSMPPLECPQCGAKIGRERFKGRAPWTCPKCAQRLRLSRTYARMNGFATLALSMALCYVIGLHGLLLFLAGFVMWIPISLIVTVPFAWVIRPSLEPYYSTKEESHFTSLSINENDSSERPKQP